MIAPTRRAVLAGSSAALSAIAAGVSAAMAASASHPDAVLLNASEEFHALHAKSARLRSVIRSDDDAASDAAYAYCNAEIWPREDDLIDLITSTPAHTPAGMRAKASVLQAWLHRWVPKSLNGTFEEEAEWHELLTMSLVNDVLAVGGAA